MNSLKQLLPSFLIGALIGGTATLLAWQTTQPLSPQGNSDFTTQGVQGGGARKDIELTFGDGTTKTLGEVHTNEYLLLNICESYDGQCIVGAEKHNALFQKRSNEGNCQLLTVTKDGDLPAWIGKIGAAPFVQKWSAYVVGGLYKLMGALNIPGTTIPYYALIDNNGQLVIDQVGWQDLDTNFAPYCGDAKKDIEFTYSNGSTKKFSELYKGHDYVLVDFSASWDGYSIKGAKTHNALFKSRNEAGNCAFAAVVGDGDLGPWQSAIVGAPFVSENSVFSKGDSLATIVQKLGGSPGGIPHYVLYDENGSIVTEQHGFSSDMPAFEAYCGKDTVKEGLYCDIDEDSFISKDGISIDPKDVPHVEKVQVGTETKYIYCDAQSCKYVSCNETTPGNDCNDTDKGITIPGTACTSPEGYPGVLDDTCTCQTNLWFCDGDLDGHKSKTPYSTDPNVVPHIKETQVGTETKFILCDANECHYVDCLHTPGDDCDDTDKNKVDCGGGEMISVGGQVTTMDGHFLGNVKISVYHISFNEKHVMTDSAGKYEHTSLPKGQSLVIRPEKRDGIHSDFVTSEDKLLIQQYLNGQRILTPEQMIAADVNNDNKIDQTDVQLITDIILGKISHFPVQSIWEFTLKNPGSVPGVTFDQTTQKASTKGFAYSIFNLDFNAIKLGDVSGAGSNFNDGGGTTNGGAGNAGVCGLANGKTFPDANSVNAAGLCIGGVAVPNMVAGNGPWDWTCLGTLGAGNAYCRAETNKGTKGGLCGPAHGQSFSDVNGVNAAGLCAQGVAVPSVVSGPAPWHRSCRGDLESSLCEATQKAGGVIGGSVDTLQRDIGNGAQ